jgi:hypothetical protein
VRVGEVGKGDVRITLSFPGWKEGKVAAATYTVPVHDERPAGKE